MWEENVIHDLRKHPYELPKLDEEDKLLYVEDDSYDDGYRCEIGYFRGLEGNCGETMWDNSQHGWILGRVIAWRCIPELLNK